MSWQLNGLPAQETVKERSHKNLKTKHQLAQIIQFESCILFASYHWLIVPHLMFDHQAFSVADPIAWILLPDTLLDPTRSLDSFGQTKMLSLLVYGM